MFSVIRRGVLISLAFGCIASFQVIHAQSSTGIHSIKGKIYLPNGRALETTVKIELISTSHPTRIVYTDSSGAFAFLALDAGPYTVVVDAGEQFEVARESFLIDKEVQNRTFRINPIAKNMSAPIYLRPRIRQSDPLRNEVINAKFAAFPKNSVQRYQEGLELVRDGKDGDATEKFRAALSIYPQFAMAHAELGKIHIRAGKLDDAVTSFRAATAIEPDLFEAHLNCGYALLNKRSLDEASQELDRAATINQSAVGPHYYLGLVFLEKKDLDGAQRKFEFARDLTGSSAYPQIHRYLGGIYWKRGSTETVDKQRKEFFKQAADELEKYIKLLPTANDAKKIQQTIAQLRTQTG